jgi:hypothetical protein
MTGVKEQETRVPGKPGTLVCIECCSINQLTFFTLPPPLLALLTEAVPL